MNSYSYESSFTITHARKLAAKVATDLKRVQRYHGAPSDSDIRAYEEEAVQLLKAGYLKEVTYGFKRNGHWIKPTFVYKASDLYSSEAVDDNPGKVHANADVSNAHFSSFLCYSDKWSQLTISERAEFNKSLPVKRTTGSNPLYNGRLRQDRTYSAGGKKIDRYSLD